ncbi:ferredoxin reductase family protein [Roseomonas marmotae]|uniref:ferredoxin reductase family protein n=1 Tax=Roseomonas marmotae TaxID=2768161 RepID=UPI001F40E7A0|nr:ferric reductase-like transmembrane domain-containing protein [Roseomonas marmotae]
MLSILWLLADPGSLAPDHLFTLRASAMQYSGILAMGCMSLAMLLAMRPRWPERWTGGLDKMYRLHKWLGIGGLALAVTHWLWAQGPRWAVSLGWVARPQRSPRVPAEGWVEPFLLSQRHTAESLGEWTFYASVILIAVALARPVPYHLFHKSHRLLAVLYLILVFHSVVLTKFSYWSTPVGAVMALLMAAGTVAAVVSILRRIGMSRKVEGRITRLHYYPALHVLECEIDVPKGWPGHKAGQFAFVTSDMSEGAHPFTIASTWDPARHHLSFVVKELGDYTRRLHETLHVGDLVQVEGPYGFFTFDDGSPRQIWVGGGVGITPFIARMKYLAQEGSAIPGTSLRHDIDLFHPTAEYSDEAIARLQADAAAAGVRLHVLHTRREGRLTGDRIREAVPDWRGASIWFCGPSGLGEALRQDFGRHGFQVARRFHQELFELR